MDIPVYNIDAKEVDKINLSDELFVEPINKAVLYQAIKMYRANMRAGTASTKTRADVSGGGKKPWRQKHTGRARAGSTRSPLWRGGGKVFGPHPRSYFYSIPIKVKRQALALAISGKLADNKFFIVDGLEENPSKKTKEFAWLIKGFCKDASSISIVLSSLNSQTGLCLNNIKDVTLSSADCINAFDVVNHAVIIVSKPAWDRIEKRLYKK